MKSRDLIVYKKISTDYLRCTGIEEITISVRNALLLPVMAIFVTHPNLGFWSPLVSLFY